MFVLQLTWIEASTSNLQPAFTIAMNALYRPYATNSNVEHWCVHCLAIWHHSLHHGAGVGDRSTFTLLRRPSLGGNVPSLADYHTTTQHTGVRVHILMASDDAL